MRDSFHPPRTLNLSHAGLILSKDTATEGEVLGRAGYAPLLVREQLDAQTRPAPKLCQLCEIIFLFAGDCKKRELRWGHIEALHPGLQCGAVYEDNLERQRNTYQAFSHIYARLGISVAGAFKLGPQRLGESTKCL